MQAIIRPFANRYTLFDIQEDTVYELYVLHLFHTSFKK